MDAIFDQGPPPPCPAPFNLAAYVLGRAEELGDKIALVVVSPDGAEEWSYKRLEAAVLGTARGFVSEGLQPGDRVLMRLGKRTTRLGGASCRT
jgi:non-ribosomal peptide synthetase component E (peptide arylation enzyme)